MIGRSTLSALTLLLTLCACGSFYEKEYKLYDSTEEGQAAGEAEAQDAAGRSGEAALQESGAIAADLDAVAQEDMQRIFVLENLHDELGRAIRDGVGDLDALKQKQDDVAREIRWRREAAGDAYAEARRARLESLRSFEVILR